MITHSVHPPECYQEKTWGCPSRRLLGKENICSLANTFQLIHEYEAEEHSLSVKSAVFHDCVVSSSKMFEH